MGKGLGASSERGGSISESERVGSSRGRGSSGSTEAGVGNREEYERGSNGRGRSGNTEAGAAMGYSGTGGCRYELKSAGIGKGRVEAWGITV